MRKITLIAVLLIFMSSCTTKTIGILRSNTDREEVFRACVQAMNEVGYWAVSSDIDTGLITGARTDLFGQTFRMNVTVIRSSAITEIQVAIIPPTGDIGGNTKRVFDKFVKGLQKRIPDIKIVPATH